MFEYQGSDWKTLSSQGLTFADIDPRALATNYDVVLMSLKTLTNEFHSLNAAEAAAAAAAGAASRPRSTRASSRSMSADVRQRRDDRGAYWKTDSDIEAELEEERARAGAPRADGPFKHSWGTARYITHPPPIMCVRFALLAVDETQKIEAEGETQSLSLCKRLLAERRLCVSGTPLANSRASDLQSLCQFLHLHPYLQKKSWQRVFGDRSLARNDTVRNAWLADMFGSMTLRRIKATVATQLALPPPTVVVKPLTFSGFEMMLYNEKRKPIARAVAALATDSDRLDDRLSDAKAKIEVLRKGCCHPQVFDSTIRARYGAPTPCSCPPLLWYFSSPFSIPLPLCFNTPCVPR